jgi:hypothetical protein
VEVEFREMARLEEGAAVARVVTTMSSSMDRANHPRFPPPLRPSTRQDYSTSRRCRQLLLHEAMEQVTDDALTV